MNRRRFTNTSPFNKLNTQKETPAQKAGVFFYLDGPWAIVIRSNNLGHNLQYAPLNWGRNCWQQLPAFLV